MKKLFTNTLALPLSTVFICLSSYTSGPGPTMHENSFKISGDGFLNQSIKLEIKSSEFTSNYYGRGIYQYNQEFENMLLEVSGANKISSTSPITGLRMDFSRFSGPGKYTLDSAVSLSLFFKKDTPTKEYDYHYVLDSDGEINIQVYEPVGGLIEGTFSGKFTKMLYNKETGNFTDTDIAVSVTDGKFSVIHYPDYHWDAPQSTGSEPIGFTKDKKKKSRKKK